MKKTDKKLETKVIRLYQEGFSMARAGEEVGVTAATVLRILRDNNIETRSKG